MNWGFVLVSAAVLLVAGFALGWKASGRLVDQDDATSMPAPLRTFLALYFIGLAILLVYSLLTLYSADYNEPQLAAVAVPPLPKEDAPKDGQPVIEQLDPQMFVSTIPQPQLKVYGYNFSTNSRVRLNQMEMRTQFTNENLITATIEPTDYLGRTTVLVDVLNVDRTKPSQPSQAVRLPVYTQSAEVRWLWRTWLVPREVHLLLLVACAGALGSYLHALQSLTDYIGNRQLTGSWFWFYLTRPFLGMALAIVFYAAIRGGFVAGSPADARSVNPFGVVAIAALVGMFADTATQKLKEIFNTLFKTTDARLDKLAPVEISTTKLDDAVINAPYSQKLSASGGKPPYTWAAQGLPAGISLDSATGAVHGTPTTTGTATIVITVTDATGAKVTKSLTLKVLP